MWNELRKKRFFVPKTNRQKNCSSESHNIDLIEAVDMIMGKFGFRIRSKIANQFTWHETLLTLFAIVDMLQAMMSFVPTKGNERLLIVLFDAGYVGFGAEFRYILNMLYGTYRMNLFFMQLIFWFDNYQWLVKANREFKRIDSISVPRSLNKRLAKSKLYVIMFASFMLGMSEIQMFLNSYLRRGDPVDVAFFHKFIYFFFSLIYQSYYSGAYFVEYHLLMEMLTTFLDQYNAHLEPLLKKEGFISSDQMIYELRQFSSIYVLIQYVKQYLKNAYLVFIISMFGVSTQCYYTAFYTKVSDFIRVMKFLVFLIILLVIIRFSIAAERIGSKCEEMSKKIYKTFTHSLNRKYPDKLQHEVAAIGERNNRISNFSLQLCRYFECVGTTVGLEVMSTPINTSTTITVIHLQSIAIQLVITFCFSSSHFSSHS